MNTAGIYLDYQATTPLDPRVLEVMMPYLTTKFGNPHSTNHSYGWEVAAGVEVARAEVGHLIGAAEQEIIFTSGATEANNMAIKGIAYAQYPAKNHIITAATEHTCVLESCRALQQAGFQVTYLPVNDLGLIDLQQLRDSITDKTSLVTVMAVNNEIGVIQDLTRIGQICREKDVIFHSDVAQAAGKIPLDRLEMNVALMSISGHKMYGPKGVGALFLSEHCPVRPLALLSGGGQERGLRSGTLSPALCAGLGAACRLAENDMPRDMTHITDLARRLQNHILKTIPKVHINGSVEQRYSGNLNLTFNGIKGDQLIKEIRGIALSSGSACATEKAAPSHVLTALGLPKKQIESSIRIGIGRMTTQDEIDQAAYRICSAVKNIKALF